MNLLKPSACIGCSLFNAGKGFSKPSGSGVNKVMLVGDALGYSEVSKGLPFGPGTAKGHVLDKILRELGMDREQFILWNVVACAPPVPLQKSMWEYSAPEHCNVHMRDVIARYKPSVIVALGPIPTRIFTHLAGKKLKMEDLQGFALEAPDYPGVRVIPTYDPGFIERGSWQVYPLLRLAIARAVELAKTGWKEPEVDYAPEAQASDIEDLAEYLEGNPAVELNVDLETEAKDLALPSEEDDEDEETEEAEEKKGPISTEVRITQVNFSIAPGTGYAVQWTDETESAIRRALATINPKHGHNIWMYDVPVLDYNGVVMNGTVDDTMWQFHHLYPDLPGAYKKATDDAAKEKSSLAGLQYCASFYDFPFPWKHLRLEQGGYYGCCDSDAGIRVFQGVRAEMQHYGVWESYQTFVARLWPISQGSVAPGIPVTREKLERFIAQLTQDAEQELASLRPLIPQDVLVPKQANGLKREPKDLTGKVQRVFLIPPPGDTCECVVTVREKKCTRCAGTGAYVVHDRLEDCEVCGTAGVIPATKTAQPDCRVCKGKGVVIGGITRWCDLKPFNPNSHVQLKDYASFRNHKIPMNSKRKYAMDKETLTRLAESTNDAVYQHTLAAKTLSKMKGTYGEGWLKRADAEGFVHSTFLFLPATGQLSSTSPNIQNGPHPTKGTDLQRKYAGAWRDAIEAKPGYVLIELDYKSYHAQTLAWEAKDWDYLRLAKLDIHSYLAAQMLRVEGYREALAWDDEKLGAWLSQVKKKHEKVRNEQAKPAILGYGFGMGGGRLYRTNPKNFRNPGEAMGVFDTLDRTFLKAGRYRTESPELAHMKKRLVSVFGCIRWFWNVKTYSFKTGKYEHGTDWEKAIAFRPANNAFCQKKIALLRCEGLGYLNRYGFVNDIHDAFMFHCRKDLAEECILAVKKRDGEAKYGDVDAGWQWV